MLPNKICTVETQRLRAFSYYSAKYQHLDKFQKDLTDLGWRFYVVDQTRGHCTSAKVITIPLWVIQRANTGRIVQYILHEIAHALDLMENGKMNGHKKPFMDILIRICPADLLIYEMTYKPKALVAAGAVFCPDSLNF